MTESDCPHLQLSTFLQVDGPCSPQGLPGKQPLCSPSPNGSSCNPRFAIRHLQVYLVAASRLMLESSWACFLFSAFSKDAQGLGNGHRMLPSSFSEIFHERYFEMTCLFPCALNTPLKGWMMPAKICCFRQVPHESEDVLPYPVTAWSGLAFSHVGSGG